MLLVLMYHKISEPGQPERLVAFRRHLEYLKTHFTVVTPGDPIPTHTDSPAVCLTFDDAYYDFYHCVYPLLHELNLKAVLGIPTAYIQDHTTVPVQKRLSVPYPQGLSDLQSRHQMPLCTWEELRTMTQSGRVYPASHSHTHANLTHVTSDLNLEIVHSKQLLEQRLNTAIDTFIYPYGRMNTAVHRAVSTHYRWGMRIGSALNRDWDHPKGLIYRIDADSLWLVNRRIDRTFYVHAYLKYLLNRLRGK